LEFPLAKKSKKNSTKKRISAQEFNQEFMTIVGGHLANLPADEQDRRIRSAHRVALSRSRGTSSTKRAVGGIRQSPLAARTRE